MLNQKKSIQLKLLHNVFVYCTGNVGIRIRTLTTMLKNMIELKISVCTESVSCFTLSKLPLILASSNAIPVDKNEITRTNKKKT